MDSLRGQMSHFSQMISTEPGLEVHIFPFPPSFAPAYSLIMCGSLQDREGMKGMSIAHSERSFQIGRIGSESFLFSRLRATGLEDCQRGTRDRN